MVKTKFILMIILLALVAKEGTMAQTHYRRIPAIELDYGTNVFGKANNFVALSISKYISRKSYWKVGVNYFEKTFQYDIPISGEEISSTSPVTIEEAFKDSKAKDWYLDGSYNYTIASNLKSIFWNIGIGAFIGTEYIKHPQKEYKFIIGPEIGTEVEFFVVPQVAILASMKEVWNPLSIHKWNTIWNIGVKVLLYK